MRVAAFFTAWWLLSTLTLWALLGAHTADLDESPPDDTPTRHG